MDTEAQAAKRGAEDRRKEHLDGAPPGPPSGLPKGEIHTGAEEWLADPEPAPKWKNNLMEDATGNLFGQLRRSIPPPQKDWLQKNAPTPRRTCQDRINAILDDPGERAVAMATPWPFLNTRPKLAAHNDFWSTRT